MGLSEMWNRYIYYRAIISLINLILMNIKWNQYVASFLHAVKLLVSASGDSIMKYC